MGVCVVEILGEEHRVAGRVTDDAGRPGDAGTAGSHAAAAQTILREAQVIVMRRLRLRLQLVDVREQARRRLQDVEVAEHVVLKIQIVVPLPLGTEPVVSRVLGQPANQSKNQLVNNIIGTRIQF